MPANEGATGCSPGGCATTAKARGADFDGAVSRVSHTAPDSTIPGLFYAFSPISVSSGSGYRGTNKLPSGEKETGMKHLYNVIWKWKLWKDEQGQDLIEYALMAGFVAVAAGALMPNVSNSISTVFSKIQSLLANAAGT